MEKRKVNGGGAIGEELDDRAAKRRKLPIVSPVPAVVEMGGWRNERAQKSSAALVVVAGDWKRCAKVHEPAPTSKAASISQRARLTLGKDNADLDTGETPESTTKSGLQLLEALKKTVDKRYAQCHFPRFPDAMRSHLLLSLACGQTLDASLLDGCNSVSRLLPDSPRMSF